jgi:hypothetical protein
MDNRKKPPGATPGPLDELLLCERRLAEALRRRLQAITTTACRIDDLTDTARGVSPLEWSRLLVEVDQVARRLEDLYSDLAAPDPYQGGESLKPWVPK